MAKISASLLFASVTFYLIANISYAFRFSDNGWEDRLLEGRFTRHVDDYELLVPRKVDHQGSFVSYSLPHFFERDTNRWKRNARFDDERVHYGIHFDGKDHVVEMWPNHGLLAPGFLVETRPSGAATDLNKVKIRSVGDTQCHYTGWIKGEHGSRVALSVCNGIAGHIRTKQNHYYIEPVKDHEPEEDGQHLHMVYQRSVHNKNERSCGTNKKFLQTRNGTDYEQFLLTAVNMAADIFHDDSVGHQLDLTLVRVIYLEKEEEEVDLTINIDADETLTSFCKWATRINPATSHPNHHDIAVLFTKYDICAGMDDCGAVGLANIAGCCGKDLSCAICQDTGLVVGTVMAHEIGHLLGANHDSDEDNPPPGECPGAVGEFNIHVMASWSQVSPANWSVCSRNYITEFLENDLGACLLDEPQDHDFKFPQMPPGVVYDRAWQCRDYYGPTEPCDLGPERNCIHLSCKPHGSKKCQTKGPPADGTSCGNNKWCFEGKCVEVGVRPGAINGEWGEWSSWSECSRTCGGGAQYIERKCNNPRPANNGRYCVGKHRQYRLCNIEPCAEDSLTFREFQCQEHNEDDIKWTPFNDGKPEHVCSLMCLSNKYVVKTLKRRVEDGTSCKRGTKNKCIAGRCRNVGCDLVLDSDAVEDICGVCNGDASTCEIVDEVYRENGKGYKKIVTIPAGSRQITVEEMKPSNNFLAVSAADGKTFYLNGNHEIDPDGESKIAGSISAYSNVEPGQESLVISGPIKEDIILYLLNSANPNPGIHYRFSIPSTSSNYKPKFSWQLVNWSPCSVFCGGGTQFSEPSCIEERGGKVSNKHCENLPKPEVNTRLCNEQTCKIRWRTSEWSKCSGCIDKPGHKLRVVECVKQSPFEDSEVIIEESECKKEKPSHKESCTSKEPCGEKSPKRQVSLDDELVSLEDEQRYDTSSGLVVDKEHPEKFKIFQIPMKEDVNDFNFSDEALENVADKVASPIDPTKVKVVKGEEAQRLLQDSKKKNKADDESEEDADYDYNTGRWAKSKNPTIPSAVHIFRTLQNVLTLLLTVREITGSRSLRCARTTLHMNLFASFAINNALWLLWYRIVVNQPEVIVENGEGCKVLHVILHYFLLTNYAWMLCEGFYLHTLLVAAFISESRLVKWLYGLGWAMPLAPTIIYTSLRASNHDANDTKECWINESPYTIVLIVPVCASMVLNLIFLCNILRVLLLKLRAGPRVGSSRPSSTLLQALRATLLLVPLLGLHYLVTPFRPSENHPWEGIYEVTSAITASFQVVAQIKRRWQHLMFRPRANSCTATTVSVRQVRCFLREKRTKMVLPWVLEDSTKTKEMQGVELSRYDKEGDILRVRHVITLDKLRGTPRRNRDCSSRKAVHGQLDLRGVETEPNKDYRCESNGI
ncbi:hypothetical protein B7P43_G05875 [Cryptotermes secundus]|uniref:Peptidase M12B domain-containing protein n=1 Tax=Cryptotermes secundus TaxID=105785 RepID=A0A2J7R191_9NEOP|nr:hypothetical protein B7P43_G05875 [Cryptotermes secundus]